MTKSNSLGDCNKSVSQCPRIREEEGQLPAFLPWTRADQKRPGMEELMVTTTIQISVVC